MKKKNKKIKNLNLKRDKKHMLKYSLIMYNFMESELNFLYSNLKK